MLDRSIVREKNFSLLLKLNLDKFWQHRESSFLKEVQPDELHSRLQDPSFLSESQLIDVREPDEM